PEHEVLWERVPRDAVVISGPRVFVPQTIYQPQSQGDKERYVSGAKLQPPIIFYKPGSPEWGVPLQDLLSKQPDQLAGGNEPAFTSCGPSIGIRVHWPGYPPWHKQVPTKDYTSKRSMICRERLAKLVAKCIKQYMETLSQQVMERGSDLRWRVGTFGIGVDDVVLVSLHHVSQGSWQPHIRLRGSTGAVFASSQDPRTIVGPSMGMYR
ncbi:hypothetical protein V8E55_008206, partial [Tylopilus felleus]